MLHTVPSLPSGSANSNICTCGLSPLEARYASAPCGSAENAMSGWRNWLTALLQGSPMLAFTADASRSSGLAVPYPQAWLEELIECGDVPALSRLLPEEAVEAIAGGLQLDVCPGALAAWLLGSLTPGGFNFVPYRDLTGGRRTSAVRLAQGDLTGA